MTTPRDFYLTPVNPSTRPSPFPPRYLKRGIYNNTSVFLPVDKHAIDEARTNYRNFRDLVWNLIYKKQYNELEKARVIFRWMTTKNLFTIMFDSELPGSPEQIIGGFKDGKTTYASIFECLAVYSGMHCVTITGWAKGVDYKPGMQITGTPVNHTWNAVYIDGNWQLVDCHWATRYQSSERKKSEQRATENLVYEYDDFYFLTEPSMLIYSHCPVEPALQLLHPTRSRVVYEEYPLVKSFFFSTGMQFLQQNRGIVYTRKGVTTLTLGFTQPTMFTFTLGYGDSTVENIQGIQLKRYVIQETIENRVTFYFRSPREGNYFLRVFSQPRQSTNLRQENVFKAACEYKIVCDQPASDIRPFPLCADANWGAGGTQPEKYAVRPAFKTALLAAPNGRAEVSFRKTRDVRLHARLVRDGMDDESLEKAVRIKEQENAIFVAVQLPTTGEYGLEIYANDPQNEGDTFTHMCQYLVAYTDRDLGAMYGQVYDRKDLATDMQAPSKLYESPRESTVTPPKQEFRQPPLASRPPGSSPSDSDGSRRGVRVLPPDQFFEESSIGSKNYDDELDPYNQQKMPRGPASSVKQPAPYPFPKPGKGRGGGRGGNQGYDSDYTLTPSPSPLPPTDRRKPNGTSPTKPLEIVYVTNITEKVPGAKKPQEPDKSTPVEVIFVPKPGKYPGNATREEPDDDSSIVSSSPGSSRRDPSNDFGRGGGGGRGVLIVGGIRNPPRAPSSQDQGSYVTGPPFDDEDDNYPLPPPGYLGDNNKSSWLPPGQSQNPYWKDTGSQYSPPYGIETGDRPYYGQDKGGVISSQAPFDTQTVVPIYHVPYPFGKDGERNGFDPMLPTEPEQEYKPHPQKMYTSTIAIRPPPTFKPIPIQDEDPVPRPAPPAVPPKPFKDTSIFENVDIHAVEVSKEEHKSFRDLVWHLIYAREITNELEKSRAIFLWLCSKDLSKLNFDNARYGSPEEILMKLQSGQTTYAVVYEILCSYAGLHCKTITGYAKGAEYKPGMRFTGEPGQHSWNAVLVNGAWRLVDCHWAARRLVGKQVTVENVRYELDEYYFMPDPHQLIFTHFPDDVNWQLLDRQITLTDFENLVPVKSAFFKYGLQILGHREAVIHTRQEVTIRIGCPQFKAHALAFTFTLSYSSGKEEYHGMKLNRFGMQEMLDNVSFFTIRPPEKGSYRLIIYAKDLDQPSREGVYGGVCEYELVCDDHPEHSRSFPPCVHTSWGPGDSIAKYALVPLQKGAIFSTVNGLAEVRFQMPKELRFTAKLKSNERDERALAGFVMNRVVGDVTVFTVNTPSRGEYGLEIYANDPDVDGNSLYHAYQYLIICDEGMRAVDPLPALPPGYLGPQPAFARFGLTAASHVDPYIQTDDGEIQIAVSMSQLLRVTSQLVFASDGRAEDVSEFALQQSHGDVVVFFVKMTRLGLYKFQIYALPFHDTSDNLPGVYNYLINCTGTRATLVPYPKQYGQWKEGCYLYEPMDGHLQPNVPAAGGGNTSGFAPISFKLEVPRANAVAVVIGEEWRQLERGPSGAWEGEVDLERQWGRESKVAICANFSNVKTSYSTLLEYAI